MFKPIPIKNKISNNFKLSFSGLKVLLFFFKSVPWTGNELAGYDVENCESSQWTDTSKSLTFLVILYRSALKYCPIAMYTYLHQALPRVDTSYPISKEKIGSCENGSALRRRTMCIKRRFRRRLTKWFLACGV